MNFMRIKVLYKKSMANEPRKKAWRVRRLHLVADELDHRMIALRICYMSHLGIESVNLYLGEAYKRDL